MADLEVVPFLAMPSCAFQHCVVDNSSTLPCPTLTTPCQLLTTASATTDQSAEPPATKIADDSLCTTVPISCYCDLPNPLQCAWDPCRNGMDPREWLHAEDWFNATCPNAASIPFHDLNDKEMLPECASQCLQNAAFDSGCIIEKTICFCPPRSLFGCAAACNAAENTTIANWYSSACAVSLAEATAALQRVYTAQPVISANEPWVGFKWYEILVLVVLSLIVLAGLVYLSLRETLRKRHQQHVAQLKRQ
jgi:hypothetical protein